MNLGKRIYSFRTERGMSQEALAEALDVSRQSVSKWENDSAIPELEKLLKMRELFGVTLDQLVGTEAPTPSAGPEMVVQPITPPHRTIGIILLCFGLLVTLLLSMLGGFILGVMAGLPFTIVGSILIASTEGLFFKSAWALSAVYAPTLFYFMLNFMGFGSTVRMGMMVVWFAILILASICLHRKGKLSADSKKLMWGSIVVALVLTMVLGLITSAYYRQTNLHTSIPLEELEEMTAFPDDP